MRSIFIALGLALVMCLIGLLLIEAGDSQLVCSAPYIEFGSGCCLDRDFNHVCDQSELSAPGASVTYVIGENSAQEQQTIEQNSKQRALGEENEDYYEWIRSQADRENRLRAERDDEEDMLEKFE